MKLKLWSVIFAAALAAALAGCGMKEEDAVKAVQEKLDEASAALTDQELQDMILEEAPLQLTGLSAENSKEALAGIRSGASFTASAAQKTENGFTVTVDAVPASVSVTEDEFMEAYEALCVSAVDMGLSPEDVKGDVFGQMAAEALLDLAGQKVSQGEALQYTVDLTAKGEMEENAVSDIVHAGTSVSWPVVSEETLEETACVIIYDIPGTYAGTADLTKNVAAQLDKVFGVASEGTILMDMYLELNGDYSMKFYVDTAQFVQSTRAYYDRNLDKWIKSQGNSVEALISSGRFSSREAILDYLMKSAGYDMENGTVPAIDALAFDGTWYFEDGAVMITGKTDRFDRQEDGSLLSVIDDMEVPFVKQ